MSPALSLARERAVVAALSLGEIVSWGILYYAFGVMVTPMQAELGWSQAWLGAGFSLALLASALLALPVGRWLERHGPRGLMTVGSAAGALLLLGWARVETPLGFLALCLALGFPLASTLYEAAFSAVVGLIREERRRSLSLLVLTIVAGLASTVWVPVAQALVAAHGWRAALRILAVVLAALTVPMYALVFPGRGADGPGFARAAPATGATLVRRPLLATGAAFGLSTLAGTALGLFLVPLLLERGHAPSIAATASAVFGAGQVVGRIAFTALRRRLSLAAWSLLLFAPGALGLAALALGSSDALLWTGVAVFALASGAQTLARPAWTLELFELSSFARANGALGAWSLIGRAAAPLALGAAHDLCGSYRPALLVLALLFAGAGGLARFALARP